MSRDLLVVAKTILQGTVKGKRGREVDRRRGGNTILKSGQGWTLPAQLGQLKTGQDRKTCCKVNCDAPMTLQG